MKSKYKVYLRQTFYDKALECDVSKNTSLLGETWAVSEEKAINNVRYRVFGEHNPEGEREIPYACGGLYTEFIAEKIN